MKHTNNLGQRLTNIKVAILKTMDELIRLEKLLEEKNSMKNTEDSSSLPMQKLHQLIAYMTQELVRLTELNDKYESYLKEKEDDNTNANTY